MRSVNRYEVYAAQRRKMNFDDVVGYFVVVYPLELYKFISKGDKSQLILGAMDLR
jgi:hypothetical protein